MGAAAMLVCDAWFDVVTSASAIDFGVALGSAVVVELPLAVVCVGGFGLLTTGSVRRTAG